MPRSLSGTRGFTLVEILVTLTIIGILIGTTVPSYMASRPARELSQTTNNLAANLNLARTTAIKNNAPTYVEFLPEIDMYRIWEEPNWNIYAQQPATGTCSVVPFRQTAPLLRYSVTATSILYLERDYSTARGGAASAGTVSDSVDIRMNPCRDGNPNDPALISRNGCLSRQPLLFIKYFPDGKAANSWDGGCTTVSIIPALISPNLGFTQLTLQVRGGFNPSTGLDFNINPGNIGSGDGGAGGSYPNGSLTPNQTLPYDEAISDGNGRRVLINHANGRITVEGYAPFLIDVPTGEDTEPDWRSPLNNKEWI